MVHRLRGHRRRTFYALAAVVLVALAVPVSFAVGARSMVTLPVEKYNSDCGGTQKKKVIGSDTFKQTKHTLRVSHSVNGADPGNYWLYLEDGQTCSSIAYLGHFKVGSDGHGNLTASTDVSGSSGWFFVCDYNRGTGLYDCDGDIGKP